MATDEDYTIEKTPVYGRDQLAGGLFGWSWLDMATMVGTLMLSWMIWHNRIVSAGVGALTYLYLRRLKVLLPEGFATHWVRHNLRRDVTYVATARDTTWRPPVVAD